MSPARVGRNRHTTWYRQALRSLRVGLHASSGCRAPEKLEYEHVGAQVSSCVPAAAAEAAAAFPSRLLPLSQAAARPLALPRSSPCAYLPCNGHALNFPACHAQLGGPAVDHRLPSAAARRGLHFHSCCCRRRAAWDVAGAIWLQGRHMRSV